MATCFVIQPFDGGMFDKRFADVFAPAVKDAGLDPYRVDQDPSVSVPIAAIEQGIRDAALCLADITTDNPNVWFELGFALASGKEVVMVCSKERVTKFPFDVQHRSIISYTTEAPSDFQKLRESITARVRAVMKKGHDLDKLAATPLREAEGLLPHEMVCLAVVMENTPTPGDHVPAHAVEKDMRRAGFTSLAASLSLRSLLKKRMVETEKVTDDQGYEYVAYFVSERGQEWLLENQDKLVLRAEPEPTPSGDPNIPF